MKYFAIDTETTGLSVANDQIIEVSVVAAEYPSSEPIVSFPYFSTAIAYERITGDPAALAMNARVFDKIARRECLIPPAAWSRFTQFIGEHCQKTGLSVTVAGKNVWKTDLPMILKALSLHGSGHQGLFDHRALDPAPYYFDPRKDEKLPSLAECCKRAGFPDGFTFHDSYHDCLAVVACLHAHWDKQGKTDGNALPSPVPPVLS